MGLTFQSMKGDVVASSNEVTTNDRPYGLHIFESEFAHRPQSFVPNTMLKLRV